MLKATHWQLYQIFIPYRSWESTRGGTHYNVTSHYVGSVCGTSSSSPPRPPPPPTPPPPPPPHPDPTPTPPRTSRTLQWRHNGRDCFSNHQPHDCLFKCSFRRRAKKTSKLHVTGLCGGNSRWPVNSPHKGPVTRKMFSFDDVSVYQCKRSQMDAHYKQSISLDNEH